VLRSGQVLTRDLGGTATTDELTDAIVRVLHQTSEAAASLPA
jgi:isocitrate/isopropylmalate dehydrogenase